MYYFINVISF